MIDYHDVKVKRWLREHRLVKLHKRLGHALALPSLAAVLRPLAKALRLFVQLDESQSLYDTFDLYIIVYKHAGIIVAHVQSFGNSSGFL